MKSRAATGRSMLICIVLTSTVVMGAHAQYREIWTVRSDSPDDHLDLGDAFGSAIQDGLVEVWGMGAGFPTPYGGVDLDPPPDPMHSETDPMYGDTDGDGLVEFVGVDPFLVRQELVVWDGSTGAIEDVIAYGGLSIEPRVTSVSLIDVESDGTCEILVRWKSIAARECGATLYGFGAVQRTSNGEAATGGVSHLRANTPNPFNPTTMIPFELAAEGDVTLRVYDVSGRLVRKLVEGRLPRGRHEFQWNGLDGHERSVASGAYFYELTIDGTTVGSRRAIVLE